MRGLAVPLGRSYIYVSRMAGGDFFQCVGIYKPKFHCIVHEHYNS
jgi:hypothetical protein